MDNISKPVFLIIGIKVKFNLVLIEMMLVFIGFG